MVKAWIIFAVIGTLAATATITAIVVMRRDKADDESSLEMVERRFSETNQGPPNPEFTDSDSRECQSTMLDHYNYVNGVWEAEEASKEALDKRFANILALQKSEGIELVNNEDFLNWTISDWD